MLIGVWADSSASINDGWLSDEACRMGGSKLGVPDLLMGREKLKAGRGSAEDSEAADGDRWKEGITDDAIWCGRAALPEDSFREGSD